MTRLDRNRLEAGRFPHTHSVATRFSDVDLIGHVNNVAVGALLQEARYHFIVDTNLLGTAQCQLVIAAVSIEFANDMFHPEPVAVSTGILEIGRTSFRVAQVARQNGRIGAYAETVQVTRDASGSIPLPAEWRDMLDALKIDRTL